jgi:hypothetical protein
MAQTASPTPTTVSNSVSGTNVAASLDQRACGHTPAKQYELH